jgi:hypothetical protein
MSIYEEGPSVGDRQWRRTGPGNDRKRHIPSSGIPFGVQIVISTQGQLPIGSEVRRDCRARDIGSRPYENGDEHRLVQSCSRAMNVGANSESTRYTAIAVSRIIAGEDLGTHSP